MIESKKYFLTSEDSGHTHLWNRGARSTSFNSGHSHPIDIKSMSATQGRTNHTHKLLKKEVKIPWILEI